METKRSNSQSLNNPHSSNIHVLKTGSDISLSPSQAAEQAKINARKNPLDALSRSSLRNQGVEKRSGLQDVDDDYFKKHILSHSSSNNCSGLNGVDEQQAHVNSLQAQADALLLQMQHESNSTSHSTQILPASQSHQPIQQSTENVQQPSNHQSKTSTSIQCKNQTYKESHLPCGSRKQHHQQGQSMQPSTSATADPELCTTCPNCQTTIYLVRGHLMSGEPPQSSMSSK